MASKAPRPLRQVQSMLVLASVKLQVLAQDKIRAQRGSPAFNTALEDALEAAAWHDGLWHSATEAEQAAHFASGLRGVERFELN